ncbi:hypothetical protein NSU_3830 [Novosphingobium pentaromativorans US6-1]|uniref:Uncharacterized protein n=1 Tax=Novosphingobium pentaromativorans US6-1 TaxID=1088721 RepID=G6EHK9_9SPHN|nr:hypothetical protein NSU_3830 [Novosphingobium pentaromativorans US6-1]
MCPGIGMSFVFDMIGGHIVQGAPFRKGAGFRDIHEAHAGARERRMFAFGSRRPAL